MEGLTRLVTESLVRHGFDRPVDYRRLRWSRWFRCESTHSLLSVPSRPGVFAIAEEIMDVGAAHAAVGATALGRPAEQNSADVAGGDSSTDQRLALKRMLGVVRFYEDDDMAYVLDRMFFRENPLRARLSGGRCFVRYVIVEDRAERRNLCAALNQWLVTSTERATGVGAHFASSLELASQEPSGERSPSAAKAAGGAHLDRGPNLSAPATGSASTSGPSPGMLGPSQFPSGF